MQLPPGSSTRFLLHLLLLSWLSWFPAPMLAEMICLTNTACTGSAGTGQSDCLTTQTCPGGCLSRRYTRPSGELLALRLDCARAEETAGIAEIRYCRHRADCNQPGLQWLPSSHDRVRVDQDVHSNRKRSCLDWNGQSKSCRSDQMCVTLDHVNRSAGCQADMLQLYELVNTSRVARYAVTQLVCRQQSMCTGTADSLMLNSLPTTTSVASRAENTLASDDVEESVANERDSSDGCFRRLLRWRKNGSKTAGDSRINTRASVSGTAQDEDRALALCMRQLWLNVNNRESNEGNSGSVGGGDFGGSGGLLLKALSLAVCLLLAALLAVLIRGLLTRRRRIRAARRRRRRQRQELQQQQQQQQQQHEQQQQQHLQQSMNSPTDSAVTTLTLPRRAVQLLLQFDEQLHQQQLQQQQHQEQLQQHSLHHCSASTGQSSPCATIRQAPRQQPPPPPHLLLTTSGRATACCSHTVAAAANAYSGDVDTDEDTFV